MLHNHGSVYNQIFFLRERYREDRERERDVERREGERDAER